MDNAVPDDVRRSQRLYGHGWRYELRGHERGRVPRTEGRGVINGRHVVGGANVGHARVQLGSYGVGGIDGFLG